MSIDQPASRSEPLGNRVGPWVAALFVVLAIGSAFASVVFWILGVGVPRSTHNFMALLFTAIDVACVAIGARCLRRGHRVAALATSLVAFPACVGAVAVAAYVFHV